MLLCMLINVYNVFLCLGLLLLGFIIIAFALSMKAVVKKSDFVELKDDIPTEELGQFIENIERVIAK